MGFYFISMSVLGADVIEILLLPSVLEFQHLLNLPELVLIFKR